MRAMHSSASITETNGIGALAMTFSSNPVIIALAPLCNASGISSNPSASSYTTAKNKSPSFT